MKAYFGVELEEEKARQLAELLSQGVEEINQEPPKLVIGDEKHLVLPGVLLVEDQKDVGGKLVLEGKIVLKEKRFRIEIS